MYGSVQHLLENVLGRFGVETTFVDATDAEAVEAAIRPNTRLLHLETIANPTIVVADLADLIDRAHRRGVTVSVDNTFASPYLCRPIELGADLVVESLTKWIGGHSDVLGGAVVGGASDRPRSAASRSTPAATSRRSAPSWCCAGSRRCTCAWSATRECAGAGAPPRAERVVATVWYPGLPSHPQFGVAQRQLRAGGGMLAFDLGDRDAARGCSTR